MCQHRIRKPPLLSVRFLLLLMVVVVVVMVYGLPVDMSVHECASAYDVSELTVGVSCFPSLYFSDRASH